MTTCDSWNHDSVVHAVGAVVLVVAAMVGSDVVVVLLVVGNQEVADAAGFSVDYYMVL